MTNRIVYWRIYSDYELCCRGIMKQWHLLFAASKIFCDQFVRYDNTHINCVDSRVSMRMKSLVNVCRHFQARCISNNIEKSVKPSDLIDSDWHRRRIHFNPQKQNLVFFFQFHSSKMNFLVSIPSFRFQLHPNLHFKTIYNSAFITIFME